MWKANTGDRSNNGNSRRNQLEIDDNHLRQMKLASFGILGGIYFSSRFKPWMKYSWIILNFSTYAVLLFFGTLGYFISPAKKSLREIVYAQLLANGFTFAFCIIPYMSYYFKNALEEVFTLNEEKFFKNIQVNLAEIQKCKREAISLFGWQMLNGIFYFLLPLLSFFYLDSQESLNNTDCYATPHFLIGLVQTRWQYSVIYLVQYIASLIAAIIWSFLAVNVYLIGHEFHQAFLKLQSYLKDISKLANQNIEKTWSTTRQESRQTCTDTMEYHTRQLMIGVVTAIRAHQYLNRKMKAIQPYYSLIFSATLLTSFMNQCLNVYVMFSVDMNGFMLAKQIVGLLFLNLALFIQSYPGKILNDTQEMISQQVYDIPWYHLNPSQRKTVYIFLCQTQKVIHFYGFRIYPMNMPIALQLMKQVYSFFNILRTVFNK